MLSLETMSKPNIHVAIAIVLYQTQVLVGWREAKQHQGNKHEFPGGKVEEGEKPVEACRREVFEEVRIDILNWHPFDFIRHEYDDVVVNLHLFHGYASESQLEQIRAPWTWYGRKALLDLNFPKANDAILKRLYWAPYLKISDDIAELDQLSSDYNFYLRVDENTFDVQKLDALDENLFSKLILNEALYLRLNNQLQERVKTIHLKHSQLMQKKLNDLIVGKRYIAACHDQASAHHAQEIGCDAITLSPVLETATHPDAETLGWEKFSEMTSQLHIPVFALGGMKKQVLDQAQSHGAYGVAGIRFI